jgi:hypothetical protein
LPLTDTSPIREFQDKSPSLSLNTNSALQNKTSNRKMVQLIDTVRTKMGGDSPMSAMLMGMMPLIRSKVNEVDDKTLRQLCTIMAQAFEKVSDESVTEDDFAEWLKFD